MDKTQIYPQIGFEYKISELSAFEFQIGYHNEKPVKDRFHFIPVSIGYKFNFVPLVTSNQKVCSQINLYSSAHYVFRYDYAPSANYSKIAHDLIFSSGIDLYLTSHWGLTVEKNFGITSNYYNMWRGGAKYRF
ncbi:MAG: hypothetical protein RBS73_06005 [Prolixibacteraceae bacterium]|nr:hypothetical protein [Prolixibacteraceae bacterium]